MVLQENVVSCFTRVRTLPVQRSLLGTDRVSMIIDYGIPCSKQENWIGFVFQAGETFGGGGGGG